MNLLSIYRIRYVLLLSLLFMNLKNLEAQTPEDKVTLDLKDVELKAFIKAIEEKTKYSFIYGQEIKAKGLINIYAKDKPLKDILTIVFAKQPINFKFERSHIVLTKKDEKEKADIKRKYTISGNIIDDTSRETLIGANIYDNVTGLGTSANEYGFYSLTLFEGEVDLRFSYIGYQSEGKQISLQGNKELNVSLKASKILDEVVVYSDKAQTGINATHMGAIDIPLAIMKSTPALLGEADIMKTIQMMPGVQAGTEGSAGVYVRGGGPDENLVLLDGVPLYNVDHMFGFFSVFTPESVKKVSLYKGSFPACFGGRLSSVIDVRTNDGDMRNYHGAVGIGLLSTKVQFEGPIVKDRTSFNISARRSYLDLAAKPFMKGNDKFGYFFYDLNAKINHRFNDRSRLYLSVYNGKDKMDMEYNNEYSGYKSQDKIDLQWGNLMTALRWNYILSPKLFSNTTVAYTKYKFSVDSKTTEHILLNNIDNKYSSKYSSGIKDWAYNMDFDYHPLPKHHLKFGAGYLYHTFNPEVLTSKIKSNESGSVADTTYNSLSSTQTYAHEATLYLEDNFDIGSRFSINAGLHFSLFNIKNKTYSSIQPRLSVRYQLSRDFALKAAYTKMSQYIHLLSSYTITMPTDLWVPVTENIKPMRAHQYSLGAYYTGFKGWELSTEVYYKDMNNILEYKDGASFLGASHNWEDKVEMGKGRSFGIEFMAQKIVGNTTGWLAYTWAKSDRKFAEDGINNGKRFPYRYDRRHHVSLTLNHKFSEKIDVGASWEFYTGGTTTIAEEKTLIIRPNDIHYWSGDDWNGANYIENRNNYRMPSSHRLNLGVNFNRKTKHGFRTLNISIHNIYNAMNPTFIYRDSKPVDGDYLGDEKAILKKITILPFIPSVSYIYKF